MGHVQSTQDLCMELILMFVRQGEGKEVPVEVALRCVHAARIDRAAYQSAKNTEHFTEMRLNQYDELFGKLYRLRPSVQQVLSDNSSLLFNLPDSLSNQSERQDALLNALNDGVVRLCVGGKPVAKTDDTIRLNRVARQRNLPQRARVELTAQGASLWEKGAFPAWEYFVDEGEPRVLRNYVWICFEAKSRTWLECVHQTLKRFGFFRKNEARILVLHNWHPVYWKSFDVGYSLRINTGHQVETSAGKLFLEGIAAADNRLSETFSVLANIWDAQWVNQMTLRQLKQNPKSKGPATN
jgi:hypothetical protein